MIVYNFWLYCYTCKMQRLHHNAFDDQAQDFASKCNECGTVKNQKRKKTEAT